MYEIAQKQTKSYTCMLCVPNQYDKLHTMNKCVKFWTKSTHSEFCFCFQLCTDIDHTVCTQYENCLKTFFHTSLIFSFLKMSKITVGLIDGRGRMCKQVDYWC